MTLLFLRLPDVIFAFVIILFWQSTIGFLPHASNQALLITNIPQDTAVCVLVLLSSMKTRTLFFAQNDLPFSETAVEFCEWIARMSPSSSVNAKCAGEIIRSPSCPTIRPFNDQMPSTTIFNLKSS